MRPILFDVDAERGQMTVLFPGSPHRVTTLRIKSAIPVGADAEVIARREFMVFTPAQLELLEEIAHELPAPPDPAPRAMIEKLDQEDRLNGPIHCPACCTKLGQGMSPAIGYVEECHGCKRRVVIRFVPGAVTVVLWS